MHVPQNIKFDMTALCQVMFIFFYCLHWIILGSAVFKGLNNRMEYVEYVYDIWEDAMIWHFLFF